MATDRERPAGGGRRRVRKGNAEPDDDRRQRPLQGRRAPARGGADARAGGRAAGLPPGPGEFVWIGIHEPEPGDLDRLQKLFGLHELAIEDAQNPHQRPKIEDYDEDVFIVLKTAHYHEDREIVHFGEIHLFAGPGYVITVGTVRAASSPPPGRGWRHAPISSASAPPRPSGRCSTRWSTTTSPSPTRSRIDIEEAEKDVFDDDIPAPTARIYNLKREVIEFHRAVWPLLNPLEAMEQGGFERVPEELRSYFRDVADHAKRVDEQVSAQRELLTSVLQANLALVSVNQSIVVKRISAWAALVAVPTFIASVYGMNFDYMPELHWRIGYPLSLLVMALCVIALVASSGGSTGFSFGGPGRPTMTA